MKLPAPPKLRNILLIDDDEITNFIGTDLITSMGITETISVATGGQGALNYIEKAYLENENKIYGPPDIIFLDMNMPEMDGLEFLEKMNSVIPESGPFPIIYLLSTSFMKGDVEKAFAINKLVKDYYEKPLTEEMVMGVYNSYVEERGKV